MIGFIGAGNMAGAIIRGMISAGAFSADEIAVFDPCEAKMSALQKDIGITVAKSNVELAKKCETLIPAVKPNMIAKVADELTSCDLSEKLIISIAAGTSLGQLAMCFGCDCRIVRVMPNINALVGAAVSAFCGNQNVTVDDYKLVEKLLNSFGTCIEIEENKFSAYSAIGGCSPAFVFMFIDSLARAGVKHGLSKEVALKTAVQAVKGSAQMLENTDAHPWEMIDRVCSPGGTTIEGVAVLEQYGFQAAITAAVDAAKKKDETL